jgi:hypothetical protein
VPYQLHCCKHAIAELDDRIDELTTDEDDGLDDEDTGTDEGVDEGADEEVGGVPEHTVPLTVGLSSAPPFLFNWKPKLTVWPGGIVAFQPKLVAV